MSSESKPCEVCGGLGGANGCGGLSGYEGPCHCGPYKDGKEKTFSPREVRAQRDIKNRKRLRKTFAVCRRPYPGKSASDASFHLARHRHMEAQSRLAAVSKISGNWFYAEIA